MKPAAAHTAGLRLGSRTRGVGIFAATVALTVAKLSSKAAGVARDVSPVAVTGSSDFCEFVLTDAGQIKKLKLLDSVQDRGKDNNGFDTDAAIVTGELSALLPDLLEALGGELPDDASAPKPETAPTTKPAPDLAFA